MITKAWKSFAEGWTSASLTRQHQKDKELRNNLSERQVDKMVKDSFPASDPPSTY